jgi:hypothetical protein
MRTIVARIDFSAAAIARHAPCSVMAVAGGSS